MSEVAANISSLIRGARMPKVTFGAVGQGGDGREESKEGEEGSQQKHPADS
jgi:hypothetical protein